MTNQGSNEDAATGSRRAGAKELGSHSSEATESPLQQPPQAVQAIPQGEERRGHLVHSQSLPVSPQRYNNNWQSPTSSSPYHRNEYHPEEQINNIMDGFHATTLVGVGGLIGWTAAAAYRWLNGGDFAMFPPPVSSTVGGGQFERGASAPPPKTNNTAMETPFLQRGARGMDNSTNGHLPTYDNGKGQDTRPYHDSSYDQLAEQVQSLVQALQKQSSDHSEIVRRLSQQVEQRQANESMQRLRQQQQTDTTSATDNKDSCALRTAIFCKLVEIQVELASLRRDLKSSVGTEKWDEKLSMALEQVQSCAAQLIPDEKTNAATSKASTDTSMRVDATPVRPKTMTNPDDDNNGAALSNEAQSPSRTHAVAKALRQLILENELTALRVGAQLLYLYAMNLASQPDIPRYRKIFTTNESFQRVDKLKGGRELLRAVGFQDGEKALEWEPGEDEEQQLSLLNEVSSALGILKSPGQASPEELLDKALACLSLAPPTSLSGATTPGPTATTPNLGRSSNNHSSTPAGGWVASTLPAMLQTPDPSIISPPVTKKQGMHADSTSVSFSPPILETAAVSTTVDSSFFGETSSTSKEDQTPMESLVDANDVWK